MHDANPSLTAGAKPKVKVKAEQGEHVVRVWWGKRMSERKFKTREEADRFIAIHTKSGN